MIIVVVVAVIVTMVVVVVIVIVEGYDSSGDGIRTEAAQSHGNAVERGRRT